MSFRRLKAASTAPPPQGSLLPPSYPTVPHNSTGLQSLDDILTPGQPQSTLFTVLAPDAHSSWSKLLGRYWSAEGLRNGQKLVVFGATDVEASDFVEGCMWVDERRLQGSEGNKSGNESEGEDVGGAQGDDGRTRIAWRYNNLGKFQTGLDGSSGSGATSFTYPLTLTSHLPSNLLKKMEEEEQVKFICSEPVRRNRKGKEKENTEEESMLLTLKQLEKLIEEEGYLLPEPGSSTLPPQKVLRIVLPPTLSTSTLSPRFLLSLRSLLRRSSSIALLLPTSSTPITNHLLNFSDAIIKLDGFASDALTQRVFPRHNGFLTLLKSFTVGVLTPINGRLSELVGGKVSAGEEKLVFRLRRRGWQVERGHLDEGGGGGSERRSEPSTASVSNYHTSAASHQHGHHSLEEHSHATHVVQKSIAKVSIGGEEDAEMTFVPTAMTSGAAAGGIKFAVGDSATMATALSVGAKEKKPLKSSMKKKSVGFSDEW